MNETRIVGSERLAVREAARHQRKLAAQRQRRAQHPRIDYYPSTEAMAAIQGGTHGAVGGDQSSVINRLILAGLGMLPE